jgi:cytochrome c5
MAVLGRVGTLTALALAVCRHLDGLVFDLPSLDPEEAVLPLLAARAALGLRPAVGVLRADATAQQVRLFAALALACDADVMLPSGASADAQAALEQHRTFEGVVRERFRPSEPLLDLEVLVSPFAEHWGGAHLRTAGSCAAALGRAHLLLGARLDLSEPRAQVLLLAGCNALSAEDGARARRHVESGGDAVVVGRCATCDEEGRPGAPVFPEAKSGMERIGEGRVYALESASDAPQADAAQVVRASRELLGRGRSHLSVSGRARLFARAYLDPERKLDVHLVNLDAPRPAQGVLLHIAGQAAGAGRTGYWFAPERAAGKDGERIALNPSGFSVSTVLPGISAGALLAVPR